MRPIAQSKPGFVGTSKQDPSSFGIPQILCRDTSLLAVRVKVKGGVSQEPALSQESMCSLLGGMLPGENKKDVEEVGQKGEEAK